MTEDKRKHERLRKSLRVDIASGAQEQKTSTGNLSMGGAYVNSARSYPPGSMINLTLYLPDGSVSKVKGLVRHNSESGAAGEHSGMGVEFVELDNAFLDFVQLLADETNSESLWCPSCGSEYNLTQEKLNLAHRCRHCGLLLEIK